ncbi:MAG: hypothetical protein CSA34_03215 [Desulfobulbus propionicus]|nr:MAG: hypothetical protein CSA34_03215 [Desulfobulbus propionicus]
MNTEFPEADSCRKEQQANNERHVLFKTCQGEMLKEKKIIKQDKQRQGDAVFFAAKGKNRGKEAEAGECISFTGAGRCPGQDVRDEGQQIKQGCQTVHALYDVRDGLDLQGVYRPEHCCYCSSEVSVPGIVGFEYRRPCQGQHNKCVEENTVKKMNDNICQMERDWVELLLKIIIQGKADVGYWP